VGVLDVKEVRMRQPISIALVGTPPALVALVEVIALVTTIALVATLPAGAAARTGAGERAAAPPSAASGLAGPHGATGGGRAAARYLALGDSYTIGESVPAAERWPVQLAGLLHERGIAVSAPEIVARTGWTTAELSAAIDAAAPHGPYDLVSLLIGVNDQYRGGEAEAYRPAFAAMLRRAVGFAGGDASRVVVLSIPDWSVTPFALNSGRDLPQVAQRIHQFNEVNRDETHRAGARYVDVTPVSMLAASRRALLAPDGLHPSGLMYAEWARLALPEAAAALGAK
jgi:lysophospholipase L1-like esterase